jgi:hypothetical protein
MKLLPETNPPAEVSPAPSLPYLPDEDWCQAPPPATPKPRLIGHRTFAGRPLHCFASGKDRLFLNLQVCGVLGIVDTKQSYSRLDTRYKGPEISVPAEYVTWCGTPPQIRAEGVLDTTPARGKSGRRKHQKVTTLTFIGVVVLAASSTKPDAPDFLRWLEVNLLIPALTGATPGADSGLPDWAYQLPAERRKALEVRLAAMRHIESSRSKCQGFRECESLFPSERMTKGGWQSLYYRWSHAGCSLRKLVPNQDAFTVSPVPSSELLMEVAT